MPSRATSASMSSRPTGSRPAVGSSSSTSSGSPTIACASFVRWRMPVENPPIGRNRASSSPTRSRMSDARWRAARAGQPAQLAERRDDVGRGLVERQAVVLGHVAEPGAHADRIAGDVDAAHLDAALGRVGEPEQQAEHRRLARAVGADEADAPARHLDGSGRRARWCPDNAWSVRRCGEGIDPRQPRVCHPHVLPRSRLASVVGRAVIGPARRFGPRARAGRRSRRAFDRR